MFNYECLADVVETQNFASLRVGGRYSVPWQVLLRTVIVCPCGLSRSVSPFPCESEVPFGRLSLRFFDRGGGYRKCVVFPVGEGGQTELCIFCSGRFPGSVRSRALLCAGRCGRAQTVTGNRDGCAKPLRSRTQPGRAESLVAGYGNGFHFRLTVRVRVSRRGKMFRARGLDGSPRNAMMFRTGVRQGTQIMKSSLSLY